MSSLLDGPPITGVYPHDCPEGRAVIRTRQRLWMAFGLFRSLCSGHLSAAGVGGGAGSAKVRQWCWEQADLFLADADRPTGKGS